MASLLSTQSFCWYILILIRKVCTHKAHAHTVGITVNAFLYGFVLFSKCYSLLNWIEFNKADVKDLKTCVKTGNPFERTGLWNSLSWSSTKTTMHILTCDRASFSLCDVNSSALAFFTLIYESSLFHLVFFFPKKCTCKHGTALKLYAFEPLGHECDKWRTWDHSQLPFLLRLISLNADFSLFLPLSAASKFICN